MRLACSSEVRGDDGRALFGLRPSPSSLSRLVGSSRSSAGLVRKVPRTPLLSLASSSEYHRRRLPRLQAGLASSPRVRSPPTHQGTRGPQSRGSQTPIRSPLSVSHALRGLLPLEPSWACPIPLALLGFLRENPPVSGASLAEAGLAACSPTQNRRPEDPRCQAALPGGLRRATMPDAGPHPERNTPENRPLKPSRQARRGGIDSRSGHNLSFDARRQKRTGKPVCRLQVSKETQANPKRLVAELRSGHRSPEGLLLLQTGCRQLSCPINLLLRPPDLISRSKLLHTGAKDRAKQCSPRRAGLR